jgi:hypothetical protein
MWENADRDIPLLKQAKGVREAAIVRKNLLILIPIPCCFPAV